MEALTYTGIIPARYASTRFPGKPLVLIDGVSMIERVYRQALQSQYLKQVIVATDDDRIYDHVRNFGGEVVLTSPAHQSGTDRCAEVISKLQNKVDVVINIQGDEPFINPVQIDLLASCFKNNEVNIATLIKNITDESAINNPNVVKVVTDFNGKALYFSRHAIPFNRSQSESAVYYKHIGMYAYHSYVLMQISKLHPTPLEITESLEQLRWLQNGFSIQTALTDIETIAVDTPQDLLNFK